MSKPQLWDNWETPKRNLSEMLPIMSLTAILQDFVAHVTNECHPAM